MERYRSTGQSPQWAAAPTEKEEEDAEVNQGWPRCEGPWNISDSMSVQPSVCQTERKEY